MLQLLGEEDAMTTEIDWRSVFIRYVEQVSEEEGVTFLEEWRRGIDRWPSDAEWAAIQTAVRQADTRETR